MNDEEALLAAIAAHPEEDTPRLAFADYFDERGGASNAARAEFIRIEVELSRLPENDGSRAALRRREAELWFEYRRAWRALLPPIPGISWRGYDRGFFTAIDADQMELFVQHAEPLFAVAPVQSVRVLAAHPNVTAELARVPELIRLRELDLTACRGEETRDNRFGSVTDTRAGITGVGYTWSHTGVITDGDARALARNREPARPPAR